MSCLYPGAGFDTGLLTDNGKKDLIIMPFGSGDLLELSHANSIKRVGPGATLVRINGKTYLTDPVPIPCGHCVACRLEAARQWKERLVLESQNYPPEQRLFVTVTYDDAHLPVNEDGEPTLVKHHLQQFIKNIRNHYPGKIRYFGCGEYGGLKKRPHGHFIILGPIPGLKPRGCNSFDCVSLELAWANKGFVDVQLAEPGSMAYVCGYVEKKQADPDWFSYPVKPFTFMSDKPGIGFNAIPTLDLKTDPHVYGNFGHRHYSSPPQALLRKLDGTPGFDEYKARVRQLGKEGQFNKMNVYHTSSPSKLGDLRERGLNQRFQEGRQDKL